MTDVLEKEWKRVGDNPDNLIISDSLRDRLSKEFLGAEVKEENVLQKGCVLSFEEYKVPGKLESFSSSSSDKKVTYTIISSANDAMKLINKSRLINVSIFHGSQELTSVDTSDLEYSVEVSMQEDNTSMLTVNIG